MVANSGSFPQYLLRIMASEEGDRLLREQPSIDRAHVDWDALRALPADTLGGAYARYLDDNGLDPDLFQAPPGLPPIIAYIAKRTRQTHDIWHVLTGYRPDVAGEVALQAFTYAQTRMPSAGLIAFFGSLRFATQAPGTMLMSLDGLRRGRRAAFLTTVRWEDHWTEKLDDVRAKLGIEVARAKEVRLQSADAALPPPCSRPSPRT
jgi:ubiquinone biosynthesis protein COQ4